MRYVIEIFENGIRTDVLVSNDKYDWDGYSKLFLNKKSSYVKKGYKTVKGSATSEHRYNVLFNEDEMKSVAKNVYVATDDGSYGRHGMVTAVIEELAAKGTKYDFCVAIGPMIMMKFVCLLTKKLEIPTIVSMNPIMVDGTGMCGACRLLVDGKVKFACVDGPEFDGHLVDFDQAMQRQQSYKTQEGRAMLKLQEGSTHHGGCGNCGGDR